MNKRAKTTLLIILFLSIFIFSCIFLNALGDESFSGKEKTNYVTDYDGNLVNPNEPFLWKRTISSETYKNPDGSMTTILGGSFMDDKSRRFPVYKPLTEVVKMNKTSDGYIISWYDKEVEIKLKVKELGKEAIDLNSFSTTKSNIEEKKVLEDQKNSYHFYWELEDTDAKIKNKVSNTKFKDIESFEISVENTNKDKLDKQNSSIKLDGNKFILDDGIVINLNDLIENNFTLEKSSEKDVNSFIISPDKTKNKNLDTIKITLDPRLEAGSTGAPYAGSSDYGFFSSIALDYDGNSHISSIDGINTELLYCDNANGFECSSIANDIFYETSIAIDSNNKVHMSAYDINGLVMHCTDDTGIWECTSLDYGGVGRYSSIAIDSNDKVHISYVTDIDELGYCSNTGGSFSCNTIDGSVIAKHTSIAIDSNDKVHIVYTNEDTDDLRYCENTTGVFNCSNIDTSGSTGYYPSIAIDSNNKVHISYQYATSGDLKYCYGSPGGSFSCSTVESTNDVGKYTSIALDQDGNVYISHYDSTNDYLRLCSNKTGSFICEALTPADEYELGYPNGRSIAIKKGRLCDSTSFSPVYHISYYYNNSLYYYENSLFNIVSPTPNQIFTEDSPTAYLNISTGADMDVCYFSNGSSNYTMSSINSTYFYEDSGNILKDGPHTINFICNLSSDGLWVESDSVSFDVDSVNVTRCRDLNVNREYDLINDIKENISTDCFNILSDGIIFNGNNNKMNFSEPAHSSFYDNYYFVFDSNSHNNQTIKNVNIYGQSTSDAMYLISIYNNSQVENITMHNALGTYNSINSLSTIRINGYNNSVLDSILSSEDSNGGSLISIGDGNLGGDNILIRNCIINETIVELYVPSSLSINNVQLSGAYSNVTILNSNLFGYRYSIYFFRFTSENVNINLINTTMYNSTNDNGIGIYTPGTINNSWYFQSQINNTVGQPISANVNIADINGNNVLSQTADANGSVSQKTLLEYFQNATGKYYSTPHTIDVTHPDYLTNSTVYNLTQTHNLNIQYILTSNLQVSLNSPENHSVQTIPTFFNCSVTTSGNELDNITLQIWNSSGFLNYSNTQSVKGFSNESTWSVNFAEDGEYEWNCLVYNNISESNILAQIILFILKLTHQQLILTIQMMVTI